MDIFLSYGRDSTGILHHINSSASGKVELVCPFCACMLIAVKGDIKQYHFRHDGHTCKESLNELEPISGWSHFHLNYPSRVVALIRDNNKKPHSHIFYGTEKQYKSINSSYRDNLVKKSSWNNYRLENHGQIIAGAMTLLLFSYWMVDLLDKRIIELKRAVKNGDKIFAQLEIETCRYYNLLNSTLYLFEYQLEDQSKVYKVGRTSRAPEVRLEETSAQLQAVINQKIVQSTVIKTVKNCGFVENYIFYRYQDFHLQIANFQEYLLFNKKTDFTKLVQEFEYLSEWQTWREFSDTEKWILSRRWIYEKKRLDASKKAIQKIVTQPNHSFGRPKGTKLSKSDYLEKYSYVIALLKRGHTMQEITKRSKASLSTIKRVKNLYNASLDNQ